MDPIWADIIAAGLAGWALAEGMREPEPEMALCPIPIPVEDNEEEQ